MARDITAAMATEFSARSLQPILLAQLEFDSATLYMWSGLGDLVWDGNTYIGAGNLINVSTIEESQNLEAKGIVCSLSGIPSTLVAIALGERSRGRPFRLWLGAINTVGGEDALLLESGDSLLLESGDVLLLESSGAAVPNALVEDPYRIFTGLMDVMELSDDGETAIIRLSVESSMILGQRSKVARYTAEDQKKTYATDDGLNLINQLQDKEVVW